MAQSVFDFAKDKYVEAGEAVVKGKKVKLYLAEIPLDSGKIIDLLSYDKLGMPRKGGYLDFEITGEVPAERHAFGDNRITPDPKKKSALQIFAVTLEKSPADLFVRQSEPGNIFHNDEKPELTALVEKRNDAKITLRTTVYDADGQKLSQKTTAAEKENKINLFAEGEGVLHTLSRTA